MKEGFSEGDRDEDESFGGAEMTAEEEDGSSSSSRNTDDSSSSESSCGSDDGADDDHDDDDSDDHDDAHAVSESSDGGSACSYFQQLRAYDALLDEGFCGSPRRLVQQQRTALIARPGDGLDGRQRNEEVGEREDVEGQEDEDSGSDDSSSESGSSECTSSSAGTSDGTSDSDDEDYEDMIRELVDFREKPRLPAMGNLKRPPFPQAAALTPVEELTDPAEGLALFQSIRADLEKVGRLIVDNKQGEKFLRRAHIPASINYLAKNVPTCVLDHLGQETRQWLHAKKAKQTDEQEIVPRFGDPFGSLFEQSEANSHSAMTSVTSDHSACSSASFHSSREASRKEIQLSESTTKEIVRDVQSNRIVALQASTPQDTPAHLQECTNSPSCSDNEEVRWQVPGSANSVCSKGSSLGDASNKQAGYVPLSRLINQEGERHNDAVLVEDAKQVLESPYCQSSFHWMNDEDQEPELPYVSYFQGALLFGKVVRICRGINGCWSRFLLTFVSRFNKSRYFRVY
jgi:hypothetical protein